MSLSVSLTSHRTANCPAITWTPLPPPPPPPPPSTVLAGSRSRSLPILPSPRITSSSERIDADLGTSQPPPKAVTVQNLPSTSTSHPSFHSTNQPRLVGPALSGLAWPCRPAWPFPPWPLLAARGRCGFDPAGRWLFLRFPIRAWLLASHSLVDRLPRDSPSRPIPSRTRALRSIYKQNTSTPSQAKQRAQNQKQAQKLRGQVAAGTGGPATPALLLHHLELQPAPHLQIIQSITSAACGPHPVPPASFSSTSTSTSSNPLLHLARAPRAHDFSNQTEHNKPRGNLRLFVSHPSRIRFSPSLACSATQFAL